MIKKSFRLMLLGAFALLSSVFVACDKYDDDIQGLQEQIDALKAQVSSIQSDISAGAVITGVTETANGIKVTLSNGKSYEITNGENGKDGKDGQPGSVVEIGENGNWFIDGEDTGLAAEGKDGADGADADAVYYYPNANGNWFKVTNGEEPGEDTGIAWKAQTEGALTAVYENGVLTLYGVKGVEGGLPVNGTAQAHIASLAVVPVDMYCLDMPVFMSYVIPVRNEETEVWDIVASSNLEATYRVNPANANIDAAEFSFINRVVNVRAFAGADSTNLLELVSVEKNEEINGAINVTAKVVADPHAMLAQYQVKAQNNREEFLKQENIFALKAVNADGCEIVSDYATLVVCGLEELELVNIYAAEEGKYDHVLDAEAECYDIFDPADEHRDAYFYYDGELDLLEVVKLYEFEYLNDFIENHGFEVEYTFSNEKEYLGVDKTTNNNKFVVLDGSVVKVNKEWLKANPNGGKAAIGRTPVIFVEAKINGVVMDTASIKLEITEEEVTPMVETLALEVGPQGFEYSEIDEETMMTLPWERFNIEVYEKLGMDAASFWAIYGEEDAEIVTSKGAIITFNKPSETGAPTSTDIANLTFDPYKIQLGKDSAILTLIPSSSIYKEVVIKFYYEITHNQSFPNLNHEYVIRYKDTEVDSLINVNGEDLQVVRVKGKLIDGSWALQSEMKEFMEDYLEGYETPGNHNDIKFRIEGLLTEDGLVTSDEAAEDDTIWLGACLTDGTDTLAIDKAGDRNVDIKLTKSLQADEPSRTYVIRMSQFMYNGQRCVKYFCVEFVRPFNMEVADLTLKTLIAEHDSAYVDSAVVVKDLDGKVIYENCELTDYAKNVYKFTEENFTFTYELPELDATWGDEGNKKLNLVENENGEKTILDWYNGGGELQNDKTTVVKVTIDVKNLAAAAVEGKVKVLSSANSKK